MFLFLVGMLFGIDLYVEEVEWFFVLGNQFLQCFFYLCLQCCIVVVVQGEVLGQFDFWCGYLGQVLDCVLLMGQVVVVFFDVCGDLCGQVGCLVVQWRVGEVLLEGVEGEVLDYGRVIIEVKLRYWNYWLIWLKLVVRSCLWCFLKVLGSMMFFSVLCFCVIFSLLQLLVCLKVMCRLVSSVCFCVLVKCSFFERISVLLGSSVWWILCSRLRCWLGVMNCRVKFIVISEVGCRFRVRMLVLISLIGSSFWYMVFWVCRYLLQCLIIVCELFILIIWQLLLWMWWCSDWVIVLSEQLRLQSMLFGWVNCVLSMLMFLMMVGQFGMECLIMLGNMCIMFLLNMKLVICCWGWVNR